MMTMAMIIAMIIKRNWSAAGHATLAVFRTQTRFAEKVARAVANSSFDPGEAVQVHMPIWRRREKGSEGQKERGRAKISCGGAMPRA